MKRIFSLSLLLSFLMFPAMAQVEVGVKFGGSYNSITFTNEPFIMDVITERYGCFGGITSSIPVSKKAFIKPELLLLARGWKAVDANYKSHNIDLEYLSLPVSVGYKVSKNISVLAGAETNYLIEAYYRSNFGIDIKDKNYNRIEVGLLGSLAYQFLDNFFLELRFSRGITELTNWNIRTDEHWNIDTHYNGGLNRSLLLSLAYQVNTK